MECCGAQRLRSVGLMARCNMRSDGWERVTGGDFNGIGELRRSHGSESEKEEGGKKCTRREGSKMGQADVVGTGTNQLRVQQAGVAAAPPSRDRMRRKRKLPSRSFCSRPPT